MDNQRHESSHSWLVNISSHEFEATELVGTCGPVTSDKWFITETQKDTPRTYRYFINNTPELDCQTLGLIICPNKNGMFNQQKYAHVNHRCRPQWMIVIWSFTRGWFLKPGYVASFIPISLEYTSRDPGRYWHEHLLCTQNAYGMLCSQFIGEYQNIWWMVSTRITRHGGIQIPNLRTKSTKKTQPMF